MLLKSGGLGLSYKQEVLTGAVNGTNKIFLTSLKPWDTTGNEMSLYANDIQYLGVDYTFAIVSGVGQITFITAPDPGVTVGAKYLVRN